MATIVMRRCLSSSSTDRIVNHVPSHLNKTHLIFGSNTDVGKTICSAGLVRASSKNKRNATHYIKPLQCGGSDQAFVEKYNASSILLLHHRAQTLFSFDTPASPHLASILEDKPTSDVQVLEAVTAALAEIAAGQQQQEEESVVWLETAGGVLSPSTASPDNNLPTHAQSPPPSSLEKNSSNTTWGWTTQADLYQPLRHVAPVILVGDGRLGGISATLSSLESLLARDYHVAGILLLEDAATHSSGTTNPNVTALRQYASSRQSSLVPEISILSLPAIPSDPTIPLYDWYDSPQVSDTFDAFYDYLLHNQMK